MKTDTPAHGSGKTLFNRTKSHGQSWLLLRTEAEKHGQFTQPDRESVKQKKKAMSHNIELDIPKEIVV